MIDMRSVSISGGVNFGRVRLIHMSGRYKLFAKSGLMMAFKGNPPKRRKGWRRVWDAKTQYGNIQIIETCFTCGGWWRFAKQSGEELWNDCKEK